MSDFSSKKTRILVIASFIWLAISFYIAEQPYCYGGYCWEDEGLDRGEFFKLSAPVWIYWAYYWIKKGR